jgi:glycosyltransferase involved in cell wall biosynthesis
MSPDRDQSVPQDTLPTISVVTPSYNQAPFLAAAIESVLGQEGDFVLDYQVIDGGSTDGSTDIIRSYQDLLDRGGWQTGCRGGIRFRWVSEADRGQSDALIKGFRRAEGQLLAWLNSDDLYLPGALQSISEQFRRSPDLALVYGDAQYCDETGAILGSYPSAPFDFARLASFNFIPQPATFFTKTAYDAVGGIDGALHFAMDYDLSIRLCSRFPCRHLPVVLAYYRLHDTAKTVRDEVLLANHEEGLQVAMKHFSWAPLNLVFGSCLYYCRQRLPAPLRRSRLLLVVTASACALLRSLWLNRGVDRRDLRLLTLTNFRKLFKSRRDILLGDSRSEP